MSNVTALLDAIQQGQPQAAEELLPLVYDELRRLARQKLAHEKPGHTLQATALVHEAYLRLVGRPDGEKERRSEGETAQKEHPSTSSSLLPFVPAFDSRGHFFAAAAEAMRRILVESARRKQRLKRGGGLERQPLDEDQIKAPELDSDLLELDAG